MTSANINMGFTLASKNSENIKQSDNSRSGGRRDDLFGRAEDFADSSFDLNEDLEDSEEEKDDNNEEDNIELYNNQIPWDLRFAHSLTYNNNYGQKTFQITL